MEKEIWKDIKGYEGIYQVSTYGRIKSLARIVKSKNGNYKKIKGRIMLLGERNGYRNVIISKDGKAKTVSVHRLVASAFIDNHDDKEQVNHKNGIKDCNFVNNLEWNTPIENTCHAVKHKLRTIYTKKIKITKDNISINFDSVKEAAAFIGCFPTIVSAVLNNRLKYAKGWDCKYI